MSFARIKNKKNEFAFEHRTFWLGGDKEQGKSSLQRTMQGTTLLHTGKIGVVIFLDLNPAVQ
jgi:hypothetical protein